MTNLSCGNLLVVTASGWLPGLQRKLSERKKEREAPSTEETPECLLPRHRWLHTTTPGQEPPASTSAVGEEKGQQRAQLCQGTNEDVSSLCSPTSFSLKFKQCVHGNCRKPKKNKGRERNLYIFYPQRIGGKMRQLAKKAEVRRDTQFKVFIDVTLCPKSISSRYQSIPSMTVIYRITLSKFSNSRRSLINWWGDITVLQLIHCERC